MQNFQKSEVDAATGTAEGAGLLDGFTGSSGEQQDGDSRWLADKAGQTRARWRRPPGCVYLPWPLLCTDDLVVTALWEELFRKDSHGWERQDDGWHLERWTLGRP